MKYEIDSRLLDFFFHKHQSAIQCKTMRQIVADEHIENEDGGHLY